MPQCNKKTRWPLTVLALEGFAILV
jgi:hypothetical protein